MMRTTTTKGRILIMKARRTYVEVSLTMIGQPALGILSERNPPKGFRPAYSTRIQASNPMAS